MHSVTPSIGSTSASRPSPSPAWTGRADGCRSARSGTLRSCTPRTARPPRCAHAIRCSEWIRRHRSNRQTPSSRRGIWSSCSPTAWSRRARRRWRTAPGSSPLTWRPSGPTAVCPPSPPTSSTTPSAAGDRATTSPSWSPGSEALHGRRPEPCHGLPRALALRCHLQDRPTPARVAQLGAPQSPASSQRFGRRSGSAQHAQRPPIARRPCEHCILVGGGGRI